VGTIAASALLAFATACSSDADDSQAGTPQTIAETPTAPTGNVAPTVDGSDVASTEPSGAESEVTSATAAVPEALRFTAPLVGGGTSDGAASVDKPTVFWFWAPT
jgi:hypothetical protein